MLRRETIIIIILIWLREKMEVHLCTVSIRLATQSSWNATLVKLRNATVTRLQNPVQYMLCSEHIIRNSIRKTNTRPVWRKEKMRIKNWFEKKSLWQTCLSTTCSSAKDSYAVSEQEKYCVVTKWRWGGGGWARRCDSYYVVITSSEMARCCAEKR